MPAPPQIMWAEPSTLPSEVTAFVLRSAAFPKLRFAIVAVNKLGVPAREALVQAILSRRGQRAQLALVMQHTDGPSLFAPRIRCERVDGSAIRTAEEIRGFRGPSNTLFSAVTVVAGESGSGKTTWIKRELAKRVESHHFSATIHESIDVDSIVAAYNKSLLFTVSNYPRRVAAAASEIAASELAAARAANSAHAAASSRASTAAASSQQAAIAVKASELVARAAKEKTAAGTINEWDELPSTWTCRAVACQQANPWLHDTCLRCNTPEVITLSA
jgi:adenylylsulfate kinase-like enzyme